MPLSAPDLTVDLGSLSNPLVLVTKPGTGLTSASVDGSVASTTVHFSLQNVGETAIDSTLNAEYGIYLSADGTFDGNDSLLFSGFDNDARQEGVTQLIDRLLVGANTFEGFAPGNYTLFVVADPFDSVVEDCETNNVSQGVTLTIAEADVDLAIRDTNLSSGTVVTPSENATLTVFVENLGDMRGGGTFNHRSYLSDDAVLDASEEIIRDHFTTVPTSGTRSFSDSGIENGRAAGTN